MDKQKLLDKTTETLRPLETGNLIDAIKNMSVDQIFSHPTVIIVIAAIFFFGVFKRSKTILLTLFAIICAAVIMRYAMPAPGADLSFKAALPFVGGGLLIGGVVVYFSLVKSD